MKIKIAVCDDEEMFIDDMCHYIHIFNWRLYSCDISTYTSGDQIINNMQHMFFDVVFMDIELGNDTLGTDIGTCLKQQNPSVLLIYVSSYDSYYKKMVQAEPFGFIDKPITQEKMFDILEKIVKRLQYIKKNYIFTYKSNGMLYKVNLRNVLYFESKHRKINIYHNKGQQAFYDKLDNVEKNVEEIYKEFLRVNKSYYVNYRFIKEISKKSIQLNDGQIINIGDKYKDNFFSKVKSLMSENSEFH